MTPSLQALVQEARETGTLRGLPTQHFIDGRYVPNQGDRQSATLEVYDPGAGSVFSTVAAAGEMEVDLAVDSAHRAMRQEWGSASPAQRGRVLHAIADRVRENAERMAVIECLDSGKRLSEALGDVRSVIRTFEYYAGAVDKMQGESFPLGAQYLGFSEEEPVGVCAQIIPWNYPVNTAARSIAPALAAGCALVVKPAESTSLSALYLAELAQQAGLPSGVLNVVSGTGSEAGAPLVEHPRVQHITFTGSVPTGQRVMQAASRHVTRVLLELGGKSPLAVLADCAVDRAVEGVLGAIYENAGQICSAGSRLLIERRIYDQFMDQLLARIAGFRLGHGLDDLDMGPLNSRPHLEKVHQHVSDARARGNEVLIGGNITHPETAPGGWFYQPTVVVAKSAEDAIVQEEIFGPVLTVQIAEDLDEIIALANGTDFALVAGVYTQDISQAYRFARAVDAGQVYINEYFAGGIEVPFGGNRKSGFGREKGMQAIRNYCKLKSIVARI